MSSTGTGSTAADGVYFTAGDPAAVDRARKARVLVSTPRAREALESSPAAIDALVFSGSDEDEQRWARRLQTRTKLMVETEGAQRRPLVGAVRRALAVGGAARSAPG